METRLLSGVTKDRLAPLPIKDAQRLVQHLNDQSRSPLSDSRNSFQISDKSHEPRGLCGHLEHIVQ